ncbi:hypothetical protein AUJ69_04050 [Candidatus Woesearchaeota archaeon CG1_02_47_18]|nr:MAG: hypothetical protein AUJ69_04050 [Candidatus Woesearchaeota archaeon CG1_02_47_18]
MESVGLLKAHRWNDCIKSSRPKARATHELLSIEKSHKSSPKPIKQQFQDQPIYCFGNRELKRDNIAVRLASSLKVKGIRFESVEPLQLIDKAGGELILLDAAEGVDRVTVIDEIDALAASRLFTLHDLDLGFFLRLMRAMGRLNNIRIICVPRSYDIKKAGAEVKEALASLNNSLTPPIVAPASQPPPQQL